MDKNWTKFRLDYYDFQQDIILAKKSIIEKYDNESKNNSVNLHSHIQSELSKLDALFSTLKTAYKITKEQVGAELLTITDEVTAIDMTLSPEFAENKANLDLLLEKLNEEHDALFSNNAEKAVAEQTNLAIEIKSLTEESHQLLVFNEIDRKLDLISTSQGAYYTIIKEQSKVQSAQIVMVNQAMKLLKERSRTVPESFSKLMGSDELRRLRTKSDNHLIARDLEELSVNKAWTDIGTSLPELSESSSQTVKTKDLELKAKFAKLKRENVTLLANKAAIDSQEMRISNANKTLKHTNDGIILSLEQERNEISPVRAINFMLQATDSLINKLDPKGKKLSTSYSLFIKILERPVSLGLFMISVAAIAIAVGILTNHPTFIDFTPYLSDQNTLYGVLAAAGVLALIMGSRLGKNIFDSKQRSSFFNQGNTDPVETPSEVVGLTAVDL